MVPCWEHIFYLNYLENKFRTFQWQSILQMCLLKPSVTSPLCLIYKLIVVHVSKLKTLTSFMAMLDL